MCLWTWGQKFLTSFGMGCDLSKHNDSVETSFEAKEYAVKATPGPPALLYPYVMEDEKPKQLGKGAYSIVYEATDKAR